MTAAPEARKVPRVIRGVHHIGIAVEDLEEAVRRWRDRLGLRLETIEEVPSERVRVAILYAGGSRIELLEATGDDSPIRKFLANRGPGVHHIALEVDDCAAELERIRGCGLRTIDTEPKRGAHRSKVAFVHPKALDGVLTELVEDFS